ncbi:unnamed protein product [Cuscuta campestris]|uniref:Potassium transporter n=1 Tax=Cuscuta campestris TaxID=132261 RepID=A0A484L630_9ASTE|nr:unnamed protein product [Cuscuta campestris]
MFRQTQRRSSIGGLDSPPRDPLGRKQKQKVLGVVTLAYQSLGVVYGDLSTSPLYVYKTTFSGKLKLKEDDEEIYGVLSFIFWTFTIIPLFKYIFIVLSTDDNGEGGTFALYSLMCRHARLSLLPNQQQETDEKLSSYGIQGTKHNSPHSAAFMSFVENHPSFRNALLVFVLLGTCMSIGDGVFTPSISVLSAVSGMQVKLKGLHENYVVVISCIILVGLFSIQHHGTHRVSFMFAPIVLAWLLSISSIGIYNILKRGGALHNRCGDHVLLIWAIFPHCLSRLHSRHWSIPEAIFWPVFLVATLAAVVGSQAVISATFSVISQCSALHCFPRVKIVHTSSKIFGQIYIPEINWILMCLCLAVTIGIRDTNKIGAAYGLTFTMVMFVTTCLMAMVMVVVWKKTIQTVAIFVVFIGSIELLYLSAAIYKVQQGAWIPLLLSISCMGIMFTWNYGTLKKHQFDLENKVSMERILAMGPSLGIVRVPGIGLVYTNLITGIPAIFGHFVTNLPAFHEVLVFVCVKSVQVPFVVEEERFLVSRVGPKEFSMFRCIIRYGYKDTQQEDYNFEARLVSAVIQFVDSEDTKVKKDHPGNTVESGDDIQVIVSGKNKQVKEECRVIMRAREFGIAYILGHSYARAKKSSSIVKKFAINIVYGFLSKNCRGPDAVLNVPHNSLIEVGMIYHV